MLQTYTFFLICAIFSVQNFLNKKFTTERHFRAKNGHFQPSERPRGVTRRSCEGLFWHVFALLCSFLAIFSRFFASFFVSVSTPNFQKSTPFENLALTFSGARCSFLDKTEPSFCQSTIYQNRSKLAHFQEKISSRRIFEYLRVRVFIFGNLLAFFKIKGGGTGRCIAVKKRAATASCLMVCDATVLRHRETGGEPWLREGAGSSAYLTKSFFDFWLPSAYLTVTMFRPFTRPLRWRPETSV